VRVDAGQSPKAVKAWLGTSTTTNAEKLLPRVKSGNAGGCPFLAVSITNRTWDGVAVPDALDAAPIEFGVDTPEGSVTWDSRCGKDLLRAT
jgi:hypothetical protein